MKRIYLALLMAWVMVLSLAPAAVHAAAWGT